MEFSGMTGEQKAWMILAGMGKAVSPLLLYICMPSLCMALGYLLFHGEMSRAEFFRYGGNFYTAAGMACSLFLLYWRSSRRGESFCEDATLFPESFRAGRAALFVLFGGALSLFVSALITLGGAGTAGYRESVAGLLEGPDLLFSVITVSLLSPLLEEVVFRGYMLNTMLRRFGLRRAVFGSAILFAICHVNPIWVLYAFPAGLLLAVLSIREDNILYGIFLHIGFNLPSAVLAVLYRANPEMRGRMDTAVLLALLFLSTGGMLWLLSGYFERSVPELGRAAIRWGIKNFRGKRK